MLLDSHQFSILFYFIYNFVFNPLLIYIYNIY